MTIAFINQKGGVGKTTSAINIGYCLSVAGYKVLLVDFDSQANLTSGVGGTNKNETIYDVIYNPELITTAIQTTFHENLFLIPSSNSLSGAMVELVQLDKREEYLKNALSLVQNDFDFILIDCPPSLGLLTINALCASHSIVIPLQCEYYAMEGAAQLIQNFSLIRKSLNPSLFIFGIILTMFDTKTNLSKEVAKEIVDAFGSHVFNTIIPRNIKIAEAPSFGQPITMYDSKSAGAKSYFEISQEVINRWKKSQ